MAYFDVLASASYGRFNIKLAKLAGLQVAVYWDCLSDITSKVVKKKTSDNTGYFILDRKYVEKQTTLTAVEQDICDKALEQLGVLKVDPQDNTRVTINSELMCLILINDDATELKAISKTAKVSRTDKAASKKQGVIDRLKSLVVDEDVELKEAYDAWIEATYSKGMQSNAQLLLFLDTVNKYSDNKAVKLELIKIGISRAYKDCNWCIQVYEREHKPTAITRQEQKQTTSISLEEF